MQEIGQPIGLFLLSSISSSFSFGCSSCCAVRSHRFSSDRPEGERGRFFLLAPQHISADLAECFRVAQRGAFRESASLFFYVVEVTLQIEGQHFGVFSTHWQHSQAWPCWQS